MRSWEKTEQLLMTIDQMGMCTIRQIRGVHDLKSYRNACHTLKKIEQYTSTTFFNKEKVFYLNKDGRALIGSTKEMKKNQNLEHTLLRNDVYLFLGCPFDWVTEKVIEFEAEKPHTSGILIKGINVSTKNKIVSDAFYTRNGYTHLVEIDNEMDMNDNHKKIKSYAACFKFLDTPKLEVFTTTVHRKRKFEKWIQEYKLRGEVKTYAEII